MHYGSIVGSAADAETFRKAVKGRVEVLKPEPDPVASRPG